MDRAGKVVAKLAEPDRYADIALAPDGGHAAFTILDPDGSSNVWTLDLARGARTPLTPDAREALMPIWAPTSDTIVYAQRDAEHSRTVLRQVRIAAAQDRELDLHGEQELLPLGWSADNTLLVGQASTAIRGTLWQAPLGRDGVLAPYVKAIVSRYMAQLSADGKWVAYVTNESGRDEVPFPEATQKLRVSTNGGRSRAGGATGRSCSWCREATRPAGR